MNEPRRYEVAVNRVVYDNTNGTSIKVQPDSDGLGLLEIDGGKDFGRIVLDADMALSLASAIVETAQEIIRAGVVK